MILKKSRVATATALMLTASSLFAAVCPVAPVTPFTAGPENPLSKFSEWVVDSNGVGLSICTDSVDGQGNPPPCFFDPIEPGNVLSQALGRGGEAFWYLAENSFNTTGTAAVTGVVVMALESAFLSPTVTDGFQTQFSRLRIRVNVAARGIYTIDHPWGSKKYTVSALLDPGSGNRRNEISDPVDISFPTNAPQSGLVTPFLKWDPAVAPAAPAGYLGDGATPHRVVGSPCGNNFIRITATGLDGVTPIAIDPGDTDADGSTSSYTSRLFTVMGKLAPASITPLSVGNAYYSRSGTSTSITVMAQSAPTASVEAIPGGPMTGDGSGRFFVTAPYAGATLPATVQVVAADLTHPSVSNDQPAVPLRDLVTITKADAQCSITTQLCTLTVQASSSDGVGAPTLTLAHTNTPLVNGSLTVGNTTALPGAVTVTSSAGGSATKPVTVVNQ